MPNFNSSQAQNQYDSRWFIWTIVFLMVSGISLVSYILLSADGTDDTLQIIKSKTLTQKKK